MMVQIRAKREADDPVVEALAAAAYGEGFEDPAAFAAKVAAGFAVVAELDGSVVGYGVALPWRGALPNLQDRPAGRIKEPEYLFVHDICVAADARGAGVGSALMRHVEVVAAERGLPEMHCIAVHGAEVLWSRLGWRSSDRLLPSQYPPDSVPMTRQ